MKEFPRMYARIGFGMCALSIALGAFGTHFLRMSIGDDGVQTFETGVRYMFMHGIAISVLAFYYRKLAEKILDRVVVLFAGGTVVFSGTLFFLATVNIWGGDDMRWIGAITPVGGTALIAGWVILMINGVKSDEEILSPSKDKSKKHHRHSRRHHTKSENSTENATGNSTE